MCALSLPSYDVLLTLCCGTLHGSKFLTRKILEYHIDSVHKEGTGQQTRLLLLAASRGTRRCLGVLMMACLHLFFSLPDHHAGSEHVWYVGFAYFS